MMENIILLGVPVAVVTLGYYLIKYKKPLIEQVDSMENKNSNPSQTSTNKVAIVTNSEDVNIDQRTFHYPEEIIKGIDEWARLDRSFSDPYFKNDKLDGFITSIKDSILDNEASKIRVLGLAGLGKTRLVFESLKGISDLEGEIFYCNAASQENEIHRYLLRLCREKKEGVLVVDNCSLELNEILCQEIPKTGIQFNLITIGKEVGERHGRHMNILQIDLEPQHFQSDVLPDMIKYYYPGLPSPDIEKIVNFSQGFPMIAKLLADASDSGDQNIGELTHDSLLRKLIGNSMEEDEDGYHVLSACSIFEKLGYTHNFACQKEFVATTSSISRLTGEDKLQIFENKCSHFISRGILERHGRFISVRPKPLAIRLAADWWRNCVNRGDAFEIIHQIKENGLANDLCLQISKLNFLPEAQKLTKDLCGPQAPFGNAEVLNTNEGSQLFRSLAEVNPHVATDTLYYHYGDADIEFLKKVDEGRRNLVWTLEKLCFRKDTFERAAKVLLNFAVAENENISNNATGQFISLFQLILPGTSADLNQRYQLIEYALSKGNEPYSKIAFSAISTSLSSANNSSRMLGAENFGSSPILMDYEPSKTDVEEYYKKLLKILKGQICNKGLYHNKSKEILGLSISEIYENGFGDLVIKNINDILDCNDDFWEEAFSSTIYLYEYSIGEEPVKIREQISNLIQRLKPKDFNNQYRVIVKSPVQWDFSSKILLDELKEIRLDHHEVIKRNIKFLIKTNIEKIDSLSLEILFEDQQQQSILFGAELGRSLYEKNERYYKIFIEKLINVALSGIEEIKDVSVLASSIGISEDSVFKKEILEKLVLNNFPLNHLLNVARFCQPSINQLKSWIDLYSKKNVNLYPFNILAYGKALNYLPLSDILSLCNRITKGEIENTYTALDIISSYVKVGTSSWVAAKETIKTYISTKGFISNIDRFGGTLKFDIRKYISELLKENDNSFINVLKNEVINHLADSQSLRHHSEIKHLLSVLIKDHFSVIWDDLGQKLLTDPIFYIIAKFHLGVRESSMYSEGILFSNKKNLPTLLRWCKKNSPEAPRLIAGIMPTRSYNENGERGWHPFALDILENFGDDQKLLNQIQDNFGSYGTIGSSVPHLESKLNLLEQISDHPINRVKNWANNLSIELSQSIEHEELIDQEWANA